MRLDVVTAGAPTAREAVLAPGSSLRLLGQVFPDLQIGELLTATVRESGAGPTLLDLKGTPVLAEGLPRLPAGTNIGVRVTGLLPQPTLEITTASRPPPSATTALPLQLGEAVTGRVLQGLPDGKLLVQVKGTPLEAAAPPGIAPGSDLSLRVVQLHPEVVFQVLDVAPAPEPQVAPLLRAHLANPVPAGEALQIVRQALTDAAGAPTPASLGRLQAALAQLLPEGIAPTAERLQALVRDGGLLLEAKLTRLVEDGGAALGRVTDRDVKGLLLRALHDLEAAPTTMRTAGLVEALTQHLGNIEAQQAFNLLASLHGEPLQLQLPFYAGKDLTTAFLSIAPDDAGSSGPRSRNRRGYDVLFLLDLDGLGKTRIDAHLTAHSVRVLFYLETENAVRRVRTELPAFGQSLEAMGYEEVLLGARLLADMAEAKRRQIDALPLSVPRGVHLVDVRA